jgi:hypothetical protein
MKSYVIRWRSLRTNAHGQGTALFTYDEAIGICTELNKQFRGLIDHWEFLAE